MYWGPKILKLNHSLEMETSRLMTLQMKKMRPKKGHDLANVTQPVA